MEVSTNIKEVYSKGYDARSINWRNIGAKYKARNIIDITKGLQFQNVLEVGAGEGSILVWLDKNNFSDNVHAIEISESGIEMIKAKNLKSVKEVQLFDGYSIPYPDDYFDLVICSHVMEHVEHERILLREIKRVSKYQVFEVPIDFSFYVDRKIKHYLSYGHINIYTPALFRFLLFTERFKKLRDKCNLHETEVLHYKYKGKPLKLLKFKLRRFVLKLFPYLMGIKPGSYTILTSKEQKEISIFER